MLNSCQHTFSDIISIQLKIEKQKFWKKICFFFLFSSFPMVWMTDAIGAWICLLFTEQIMPKSIFAKKRRRCWIKFLVQENMMRVFDRPESMERVRFNLFLSIHFSSYYFETKREIFSLKPYCHHQSVYFMLPLSTFPHFHISMRNRNHWKLIAFQKQMQRPNNPENQKHILWFIFVMFIVYIGSNSVFISDVKSQIIIQIHVTIATFL